MLVMINKIAIMVVNFVKKSPALLDDINVSDPEPIPNAPPSDLCKSTETINNNAKIT